MIGASNAALLADGAHAPAGNVDERVNFGPQKRRNSFGWRILRYKPFQINNLPENLKGTSS
jgi:hypothetical protein